jgi:hypothetical protein
MKNLKEALRQLEEEKPGLWANIRAKKERGAKPAHKNSNAHKDAVAAGKKINAMSEANINPEAEKLVGNFIMKLAKRYGYGAKDAIYLIQDVIKNIEASGKLNENEDWPKEHPSRHGDMTFRLEKVMADRAAYEILDAENNNRVMGRMVFKSPDSLKAFALDYIKPQGGRQSSQF